MDDCFFVPLDTTGDRYRATGHTTGPWDPGLQHGGPPSALLARAVENCSPREDMMVARMTCEILGPVPVGELELRSAVVRPGRSVERIEAVLSSGGRDVVAASAWRIRRTSAPGVSPSARPPTVPTSASTVLLPGWGDGYLSAVEWRFVTGALGVPGPSTVWTRLRHPLVAGEAPSPLQRVVAVADSGNGVSSQLDIRDWHFINPELTVHLHREAVGEWICLDAATAISTGGTGLATSVLSDVDGPVAVGAQALLVAPRG